MSGWALLALGALAYSGSRKLRGQGSGDVGADKAPAPLPPEADAARRANEAVAEAAKLAEAVRKLYETFTKS